ncbi:condensin subunit Smc [Peptoniphilus asaccharolyticus DSM 20463]|uniref:Chromosome partition protein Smc n=1 Tax=Peptoniphilus asaccharolyticus DSM 20463 TaxID=573058 RepID=A0A1W1UTI7_PEPAS|nr:chromosome segregation protein SMC [Peptoniphilus asaccharolyticus]MBL7575156.1 chromosome segregation protein SMC [Peptoniphilus asaccharolyticus]SMB84309.1 condensin subunit Smc [Peptoniphilus asaccharolyticus DSM 20463]
MILKTIYIQGFKSFLNKTKIDFNNSITAIVGPNGSGKSNITDAIIWVLGETSIKNLRGNKMEDVIFSGTDKRKATGFTEVSIVFDNSDGSIPLDFREVQITRRMYRSLESDFLINGTKCRLKDIRELFLDTGIGKDGYSLISQGQIDSILSNKPDERRQIFEEAAGVSKYKLRKHESELKLKRTKENVLRLNDILSELETREDDLKIASENAAIYLEKSKELKRLEISSASYELVDLNNKVNTSQEELKVQEENLTKLLENIDFSKNEIESVSLESESLEKELELAKNKLREHELELQREKSELELMSVKVDNYTKNLDNSILALTEMETSSSRADDRIVELKQEKEDYISKNDNLKLESEQLSKKINNLTFELNKKEEEINSHNLGIKNIENELSAINSKLSILDVMKSEKSGRLSNIKENLKTLYANNSEIEDLRLAAEEKYTNTKENLKSIRESIGNKKDQKEKLNGSLSGIYASLQELQNKLSHKEAQYTALKNLNNSFEGYNKSVKSLMNVTKRGDFSKEIVGPVAENFKVKKEYETAISVALGASLQNVIVDKLSSAREIIEYLNRQKMGRVTFLPMDSMKFKPSGDVPSSDSVLGLAYELIDFSPEFGNIFKNLLGRTLVVKDFNSGTNISKQYGNRYRVVTLRGDSFNIGGSVTGGSLNKFTSEIVSRRNELAELEKVIKTLSKEKIDLNEKYQKLKFDIDTIDEEIVSSSREELGLSEEIIKIENNLSGLNSSLKSNQIYIEKYTVEETDLAKQIEEDFNTIKELIENREHFNDKMAKSSADLDDSSLNTLKEELEGLKEEKLQLTLNINDVNAKILSLQREMELINDSETNAEVNKNNLKSTIDNLREEIEISNNKISQTKIQIELLIDLKSKVELEVSSFEENKKTLVENIKSKRKNLEDYQDKRIYLEAEIAKINSKIERLEDRISIIREHILETYGISEFDETVEDIKVSKSKISELKREIEELGTVNLGAVEEYKLLVERLEFTRNQIDDMLESQKEIEEIISKLESEMKVLFSSTFNKVSKYFEEIFKILFNGGRAKIELEENVLEGGIEIKAEPPGKKLQSLSLLSGGERALTAVALLFALLKVRPAPFCILDEIDAALDDANIKKYADYLMTLEDIQFIIITHRKLTMEIANVLYGVTMEEKGISKIISVKLD